MRPLHNSLWPTSIVIALVLVAFTIGVAIGALL